MLDAVIEGEREGVIEDQEREMIESIIEFKDADVSEIMTPRTDLTIVTEDMPLTRAMDIAVESGHSRLPVAARERRQHRRHTPHQGRPAVPPRA